jgi:hypothetical protein
VVIKGGLSKADAEAIQKTLEAGASWMKSPLACSEFHACNGQHYRLTSLHTGDHVIVHVTAAPCCCPCQ